MTKKDFYLRYYGDSLRTEKSHKIPALLTLAQAALESGWGEHAPGNNFFGIKAGTKWTGPTQTLMTSEEIRGKKIRIL